MAVVRLFTMTIVVVLFAKRSLQIPKATKTFLGESPSYMKYIPPWTQSATTREISFKFKTWQSNAILVNETVEDPAASVPKYFLSIYIQHGVLKVKHVYGESYAETFSMAKGMNHDTIHGVLFTKDVLRGNFTVTVDNTHVESRQLRAYTEGRAYYSLKDATLEYIITVGGNSGPAEIPSLIGCMSGVQIGENGTPFSTLAPAESVGIQYGCLDLCKQTMPCKNGGKCINKYLFSSCDCFETGFEGQFCELKDLTTVTLRGFEWISHDVYSGDSRTHRPTNRISMEFKTVRDDTTLFFSGGSAPVNYITAVLNNGVIEYAMSFGGTKFTGFIGTVASGDLYSDGNWHTLTLSHRGQDVSISVDAARKDIRIPDGESHHLHLDMLIFIGGGDKLNIEQGSLGKTNFIGCLRNVYFNHVNILPELRMANQMITKYSGTQIQYGCHRVDSIPLSFTKKQSRLQLPVARSRDLNLKIELRTIQTYGIIVYGSISMDRGELGYYELIQDKGRLYFKIVPETKTITPITLELGLNINDNQWHTAEISFVNKLATLAADDEYAGPFFYNHTVIFDGYVYIGKSMTSERSKDGFIGCIRNIKLQENNIDPVDTVNSNSAIEILLDGCNLKDFCLTSMCNNGGECNSNWETFYCDCTGTGYEGKTCKLATYPRSCEEYLYLGYTSGPQMIDIDGGGPQKPVLAHCNMEHEWGQTSLYHNMMPRTVVRNSTLQDHTVVVSYGDENEDMLKLLVKDSISCQQLVQYNCQNSPIRLGEMTWFNSGTKTRKFYHIGDADDGHCACANDMKECSSKGQDCNCDSDWLTSRTDIGYETHRDHLPITELTFKQYTDSEYNSGVGSMTVGPLQCIGKVSWNQVANFKTVASNIRLPPWVVGGLEFSFKTTEKNVSLISQLPVQDEKSYFVIKLQQGFILYFNFNLSHSGHPYVQLLMTPASLNDNKWHTVSVEFDQNDIRLMVDSTSMILTMQAYAFFNGFDGPLYIGNSPGSSTGLLGSIRGVQYNNMLFNLSGYTHSSSGAVTFHDDDYSRANNESLISILSLDKEYDENLFLKEKLIRVPLDQSDTSGLSQETILAVILPIIIIVVMVLVAVLIAICLIVKRRKQIANQNGHVKKSVLREKRETEVITNTSVQNGRPVTTILYENPIDDPRKDLISNLPYIDAESRELLDERHVDVRLIATMPRRGTPAAPYMPRIVSPQSYSLMRSPPSDRPLSYPGSSRT